MSVRTDPDFLLRHQYGTPDRLRARTSLHERFAERPDERWFAFVRNSLPAGEGLRVLECGCGAAALWREELGSVPPSWRLTLTDLSEGMLAAAREVFEGVRAARFVRADVQALPFEDDAFDLALANHMLYHVPDLPRALRELRRVLRPGGTLVAATNGPRHMAELMELVDRHVPLGSASHFRYEAAEESFRLDNGAELLRPHFEHVELREARNDLLVTDADAAAAYVASLTGGSAPPQAEDARAALAELRDEVAERILRDGALRITRDTGLFLAR